MLSLRSSLPSLSLQPSLLKIGELSLQSGVPIKTIRYYEELGLLPTSGRTEGHYRLFSPDAISRLVFIRQLKSLGLSLQEIGECLAIYDRGDLPCGDIKDKLEQHVGAIDRQVKDLLLLREELTGILDHWQTSPEKEVGKICPNLQAGNT